MIRSLLMGLLIGFGTCAFAKDLPVWTYIDASDWPSVVRVLEKSPELLKKPNEYGETVLMLVAGSTAPQEVLMKVLKLKPNLEAKTEAGVTALSYAVAEGKLKSAETLIKAGSSTAWTEPEGWNLMAQPIREANLEMLKLLHKYNPKLISQKNKGKSLVDLAKQEEQSRVVEWLKKNAPRK
jgi:hypothetical protein